MKLLNCISCQDIVALLVGQDRTCRCGRSKGRYKEGAVLAVYSGPSRLLGIKSLDYHRAEPGARYEWWIIVPGNRAIKEDGGGSPPQAPRPERRE